MFLPVFLKIDIALTQKSKVLVSIDGMCGSGKSSLGALLQKVYACNVIHTDDFFLQPEQRTQKRLQEIGGNIDYERLESVLKKLSGKENFSYQAYDCATQRLAEWKTVNEDRLTILEGSYSMHPALNIQPDVRVFLTVDANTQRKRLQERNGNEMLQRFIHEWIPKENSYFNYFNIRESCDCVINTASGQKL